MTKWKDKPDKPSWYIQRDRHGNYHLRFISPYNIATGTFWEDGGAAVKFEYGGMWYPLFIPEYVVRESQTVRQIGIQTHEK